MESEGGQGDGAKGALDADPAADGKDIEDQAKEEAMEEDDEFAESDEGEEDITFVLRDVYEMEQLLQEGKLGEENKDMEQDNEQDGAAGTDNGTEQKSGEDNEQDSKFKYSHGKQGTKYPPLPGIAGTVTPENFKDFCEQLGKRNTPFEVDLDDMAEKPWTRFNSSLDDFFNFGFNEQTWREYAARQVALRLHALEKQGEMPAVSSE
mmetsp:Transcript_15354/g.25035  ORF Transcript_15354/g.25035 Transcript_15354/m.25035 type:complete len:207 (+) Transcript_15354:68-688(+)